MDEHIDVGTSQVVLDVHWDGRLFFFFFPPPIPGVEHKLWLPSWLFVIIHLTNILHSLPVRVNFSLGLIKSPVWLSGNRHLGTSFSPYCIQLLDCLVLWDPDYLELEYLHFLCFWWARIIQKKICLNKLWKAHLFWDLLNVGSAHCKRFKYFLITMLYLINHNTCSTYFKLCKNK